MTTLEPAAAAPAPIDSQLVARSLAGDADAFRGIVARYQALVCSVTYSASGSLHQSEEIAQETFVEAWKQLRALREPEKLRSWLCGIARVLTANARRRENREPVARAESLEPDAPFAAPGFQPSEDAAHADEREILWRALERVPPIYREPLILYYREGQSTRAVAEALGSTEEAVRQQLSRGRLLLRDEVMAFISRGLAQTAPGAAFTGGVMASVGPLIASAKLGVLSSSLSGAAAKMGAVGSAVTAFAGFASGLTGAYLGYRIGVAQATSDEEKLLMRRLFRRLLLGLALFFAGFGGMFAAWRAFRVPIPVFIGGLVLLVLVYVAETIAMSFRHARLVKGARAAARPSATARSYRSRRAFLGLPLVHIDLDATAPVTGWIAASNSKAYGGLFALGSTAVAPVAVGGFAVGLFASGGVACGAFALGGLTLGVAAIGGLTAGWWSFGGCAFGYDAIGGCAVAWHIALGALAEARDYALGSAAFARHANDAAAQALAGSHPRIVAFSQWLPTHIYIASLAWVLPLVAWMVAVRWLNRRALFRR